MMDSVTDSDHPVPDGDFVMLEGLLQLLTIFPYVQKFEELKELVETEIFQQD